MTPEERFICTTELAIAEYLDTVLTQRTMTDSAKRAYRTGFLDAARLLEMGFIEYRTSKREKAQRSKH